MAKTGEEISTGNASAMADLSSADVLNDLFNNATAQEEAVAETGKLDEVAESTQEVDAPKADIVEDVVEEKIEEKPKLESKEEEVATDESAEFKLPDEKEEEKLAPTTEQEAESSWKELAKPLGIELAEDTYEAYTTAVNNTIEAKVATAKELAMVDAQKAVEEKFAKTPEAKQLLEFLNNNGTFEEYIKPTAEIEKLQALSDSELVAKDLELRGWDSDKIDSYIEDRIEKGKLDLDAYELRKILDTNKANITQERVAAQKEYVQKEQLRVKEAMEKDTNQIREALGKTNEFMDTKIGDKHKNFVMQKYEKGEYQELFKNPEAVAEFLLYKEFGKQGIENLKGKSFQNGKETIAKKLHNVPPKSNAGGKRIETQVKSHIGNVEALSDLSDYK